VAQQMALSKIKRYFSTPKLSGRFFYYYISLKISLSLKNAIKKHPQIMQVRIFSGAGDETRTRDT
jgi:hypothetical protein